VRCELIQVHLAAYIDGELENALRVDVEKHLEECRECRGTVRDMRLAAAVLGKWKTAQHR
jgi:predicted anti-sigma-YlaC factor YlaD